MDEILIQYKRYRARSRWFIWGVVLLLGLVGGVALITGTHALGWQAVVDLCQGKGVELNRQIVLNVRLPRILGAVITGMILALSGTVMQVLLRNPLASPYTLGISNAAAFGAAFGIVFFTSQTEAMRAFGNVFPAPYLVTLTALGGSLLGLGGILFMIKMGRATVETIVLSGVIIHALFGAGMTVMQYVADQVQLASIVFWNFGDLGRSDWSKLWFLTLIFVPTWIYFYNKRWDYKVLASGDDYAQSMGVSPQRIRISGMIVAALCTAVAVSFFGVIAFVGLVVPHIVRMCIGDNEEFLFIGATVFGGMFLLLCDTLARSILAPIVLPVGILTSFLGVPLFLFLLIRRKW